VTPATAEFLPCLTSVGAEQFPNANLEQGLNAAIVALSPVLSPGGQSKEFLRDDAPLLLVFLSDEDDCSLADGESLKKEDHDVCACLGDSSGGGPLRAVDEAVEMIRRVKPETVPVMVAAIVGDAPETASDRDEVRDAFWKSKCSQCDDPDQMHSNLAATSICHSPMGNAAHGRRYSQFVEAFGEDGLVLNVCDPGGIEASLDAIAALVERRYPTGD
jgi:hypothetical protein